MKKNVMILGGNGFIGTNLCKHIDKQYYNVFSFDIVNPPKQNKDVTYISGDFFDDNTLKKTVQNMDIIFHAISTVNPGNSNIWYMRGYEKDFIQTIKLCELANEQNSKMIFLSSGGTVYGEQVIQPILEDVCPKPISHYGNIKLCIENTIRTFNIQKKASFLVARISNPYGPGQDFNKGVGFIDAAIKKAMTGETIEIWGDGTTERDYIYIDNACDMLCAMMEYEGNEHTFNIGSNYGCNQRRILSILRKLGLDVRVEYKAARSVDVHRIILDNHRIMGICKENIITIDEGIKRYYNYLADNESFIEQ